MSKWLCCLLFFSWFWSLTYISTAQVVSIGFVAPLEVIVRRQSPLKIRLSPS